MKLQVTELLDAVISKDEERFFSHTINKEDCLFVDRNGRSLLINAIIEGLPRVILYLLNIPELLEKGDEKGKTPLHYCAIKMDLLTAKVLLEKGINVDKVDNFGNTSLWKATFEARGKNYDMIPLLLSYNANFNFKNNYGISPLDFAKEIGDKKLISFFSPARPVAD